MADKKISKKVVNMAGEEVGSISLDASVFGIESGCAHFSIMSSAR